MKRTSIVVLAVALVSACASTGGGEWTTLIDGASGLDNFNRLGDANWRAADGVVVADQGKGGFLVSKQSYRDFELYAEFYAETTTNSGIFLRASDPQKITAASSYEVNIFDQRPGPEYATAAIVDFARVPVPNIYFAGGKWNTFEITARGPTITVKFNGVQTAQTSDGKFRAGPFALQYATGANNIPGGAVKWRKVQVRPL